MPRRSTRVTRIAAHLLDFDLSPERPIAILSGADIDHALIGLAAMEIGVPYCPISPPYSLALERPCEAALRLLAADARPRLRQRRRRLRAGARRRRRRRDRARRRAQRGRGRGAARSPTSSRRASSDAVAARARRGRPGHDRQVPADVRLDRPAQGGDQHAAHDLRQSGDARAGVPVLRPASRRFSWTGCRGATPSAPTTISASRSPTAERSISTAASRCRAASRRPSKTCARSRRRSISTCPRASRPCCPICRPTPPCAQSSSAD